MPAPSTNEGMFKKKACGIFRMRLSREAGNIFDIHRAIVVMSWKEFLLRFFGFSGFLCKRCAGKSRGSSRAVRTDIWGRHGPSPSQTEWASYGAFHCACLRAYFCAYFCGFPRACLSRRIRLSPENPADQDWPGRP